MNDCEKCGLCKLPNQKFRAGIPWPEKFVHPLAIFMPLAPEPLVPGTRKVGIYTVMVLPERGKL